MTEFIRKLSIAGSFTLIISTAIHGQDLEPRSYAVVPKGLHAAALALTYSSGNIVTEGSSPLQNLDVTNKLISAAYVQTFGLFNKLARVSASLPYGFLNGTADFHGVDTSASRTGFYDGRIKFGINLLGSPLMTPREFQKFQERTVLGVSMVLSVPVGQYYPSKLVNLGSHRWGFKPEIGFSHAEGRLFFEMYTGIWIYTNNAQYFNGHSLDQKGLFTFQAHVDYTFKHGKYIAFNGGFSAGGETAINGLEQGDEQRNWRLGVTWSMPIFNKHQSIKFMVNTGVATRAGQNYTAVTLVYQYSWF